MIGYYVTVPYPNREGPNRPPHPLTGSPLTVGTVDSYLEAVTLAKRYAAEYNAPATIHAYGDTVVTPNGTVLGVKA